MSQANGGKLGIIVQSGAANRLCCVVVYAASALSLGWEVVLHLVNEGLAAFRKDTAGKVWGSGSPRDYSLYPAQYEPHVETYLRNLHQLIEKGEFQDWPVMLADLKKQFGERFRIYACPLAAQTYGVTEKDLLDIVDGIKDGAAFLKELEGGTIMVF